MKKSTELTGTEKAFVAMVLEEHHALIRNADANRDKRMAVLLQEKGIPQGIAVSFNGNVLEYESPDISVAGATMEAADRVVHDMEQRAKPDTLTAS